MKSLYDVVDNQKIFTEDEHSDLVAKFKEAFPDHVLYNTDDDVVVPWEIVADMYLEDGEEISVEAYVDILTDRNSNGVLKPINSIEPIDAIIKAIDELDFTPDKNIAIEIFADAADDDEYFRTKDEAKIYVKAMAASDDFEFMSQDEFNNVLGEYTLAVVPGTWAADGFERDENADITATLDFQDYINEEA